MLVNTDKGRKRLEHMRNDPRVVLDALNDSDWHTHVSVTGHVEETREDTGPAGTDGPAWQHTGSPHPAARPPPDQRRDRRGQLTPLGALKNNNQPG